MSHQKTRRLFIVKIGLNIRLYLKINPVTNLLVNLFYCLFFNSLAAVDKTKISYLSSLLRYSLKIGKQSEYEDVSIFVLNITK